MASGMIDTWPEATAHGWPDSMLETKTHALARVPAASGSSLLERTPGWLASWLRGIDRAALPPVPAPIRDVAWSPPGWAWVLVAVAVVLPTLALAAVYRRARQRLATLTLAGRRAAEAERRFAAFADTVPLGLWQIHVGSAGKPEYVYVSEGILAIHDMGDIALVDVEALHGRILPPGRALFEGRLTAGARAPDGTLARLEIEYDIRRDDGSIAHLYSHGSPTPQPGGSVLWNGYTQDLTEARTLRRAVESRTRQLQDLASGLPGTILQLVREPAGRLHLGPLFGDELKITGHRASAWADPFEGLVRLVSAADQPALWDNIERTRLTPGLFDFPLRLRHADGHLVWIRLIGHSRHEADGTVVWNGVALDTSELRRSELLLRDLTNGLPGTIWQMYRDDTGTICFTFVSHGVHALTGRDAATLVRDPCSAFSAVDADDQPRVLAFVERLFASPGETDTIEYRLWTVDKRLLSVQVQASSREDETARVVVNGVMLDITDRVILSDRLREAQRREQVLLQQRTDFLSQVSHEMRTPLNAILAPLSRLLDAEAEAASPRAQVLEAALGQCQDMLRLLADLMSASRAEQQRFDLVREPFRLHVMLEQLLRQTHEATRRARVELRLEISPGTPARWLGDEFRVRQILDNLVTNALKFTEAQGQVTVLLTHEAQSLVARVTDTGVGMGAETLERLFEPYYQGNNPDAPRKGGFGLGLAVVQRLVTEMGGTIRVESHPGRGSVFTVRLALERLEELADASPDGLADTAFAPAENLFREAPVPGRPGQPIPAPAGQNAPRELLTEARVALVRHDTRARHLLQILATEHPDDMRLPAALEALSQYDFGAASRLLATLPPVFAGSAPEPDGSRPEPSVDEVAT